MDQHSEYVLQLDISQNGNRLKIGACENRLGETNTTRFYEEVGSSMDDIQRRCRETVNTLNRANRRGRLTPELLDKLKRTGQLFRDELLTLAIKETLQASDAEHLIINLDEKLIHIPWELLHDGNQFLCQRFSMGRTVKTKHAAVRTTERKTEPPLTFLLLADPLGNLTSAYEEGIALRDFLENHKSDAQISFRSGNITPDFVKDKIRAYDVVHFAGHADYNPTSPYENGWRLKKGIFSTRDITKMSGTATMPSLVFSNACQSALSAAEAHQSNLQERLFGLADAFIFAGVRHYVGTYWEILDEPSKHFAYAFYHHLMSGAPIGSALRAARSHVINSYGEETIVWGSYILYGDPTIQYTPRMQETVSAARLEPLKKEPPAAALHDVRSPENIIEFSSETPVSKSRVTLAVFASLLLVALLSFWGYKATTNSRLQKEEQAAFAYYHAGEYAKALEACRHLQREVPERPASHLITGHILLQTGDLQAAQRQFTKSVSLDRGKEETKAEALLGLGRIASLRQQPSEALSYYQQASKLSPERWEPYFYQALLLEQDGRFAEAENLYATARKISPENKDITMAASLFQRRANTRQNENRQERIDRLARELIEQFDEAVAPVPAEQWTSRPLSVWMAGFKTTGNSRQEGRETLIAGSITNHLISKPRFKVIDRDLLDKVMGELKIGAFKLADPNTALRLGRLIAARFILSGHIIYAQGNVQISIRCLETETGQIVAVVSDDFNHTATVAQISEVLSAQIDKTLNRQYPLRAKITDIAPQLLTLDIGARQGAESGQHFHTASGKKPLAVITDVNRDNCQAKLINTEIPIAAGMRLEQTSPHR